MVLAENPGLAEAVRVALGDGSYRVLRFRDLREADRLLETGLIDACILDADLTDVRPVRTIREIRQRLPHCPVLVCAEAREREWEEEAWLAGATYLLGKPLRASAFRHFLERCWQVGPGAGAVIEPEAEAAPRPAAGPVAALERLRLHSRLLGQSLAARGLLEEFLTRIRGVLGVNRAAVFLRRPPLGLGADPSQLPDRRLEPLCAQGMAPELVAHVALSRDGGIGRYAERFGRILLFERAQAAGDAEAVREFGLLGGRVAIPVTDGREFLGVAVFDQPLSGGVFGAEELAVVFQLLEELGRAIQNAWRHERLEVGYQMTSDILDQLSSGCVVVDQDLSVLHANQSARRLFLGGESAGELQFADIPQAIGTLVYQVLQSGAETVSGEYRPPAASEQVFRVEVLPFRRGAAKAPAAALLLIKDFTQHERLQAMEIQASNLRLVKSMAEHLAHEIGNALVPLSAHQQMIEERGNDAQFLASLSRAMATSVQRIQRLSNQMLHLASETAVSASAVGLPGLVEEAFIETRRYFPDRVPELRFAPGVSEVAAAGDREALKQAMVEVLLNALQAAPDAPKVEVAVRRTTEGAEGGLAVVEVRDFGPGFSEESARRATEPFYSTKVVGLGLGLTVAERIVRAHQGRLEIESAAGGGPGLVRVVLPLAAL